MLGEYGMKPDFRESFMFPRQSMGEFTDYLGNLVFASLCLFPFNVQGHIWTVQHLYRVF